MLYNSLYQLRELKPNPISGECAKVVYKWWRRQSKLPYIGVECPICHIVRWVRKSDTRRPTFTAYCLKCAGMRAGEHQKIFRSGSNSPFWAGGKFLHLGWYLVMVSHNSPFYCMANGGKGKYVAEHRLVMAQHLGRPLTSDEYVHHINGVKTDNRLENLKLITPSEHSRSDRVELQSLRTRVTQLEAEIVLLRAQLEKDGIIE